MALYRSGALFKTYSFIAAVDRRLEKRWKSVGQAAEDSPEIVSPALPSGTGSGAVKRQRLCSRQSSLERLCSGKGPARVENYRWQAKLNFDRLAVLV